MCPVGRPICAPGPLIQQLTRATFAFIVFAFEIVRDYNAVLPLMMVTVIADLIAVRYARNSIMTEVGTLPNSSTSIGLKPI